MAFIRIFLVFAFIFLINRLSTCQESDCYFVQESPSVFRQDSLLAASAREIIRNHRKSIDQSDSLALIGVSKNEMLDDLDYMLDNPNSTNLNDSGYYCGIVVALNWMLNKAPDKYVKAVIDLSFYGETSFEGGSKKVRLPEILTDKVDYSRINFEDKRIRADIGNISLSDFVLGVSLVNSEKALAARSFNAAQRRNKRLNKTVKDRKYLEIPFVTFFKGLKG